MHPDIVVGLNSIRQAAGSSLPTFERLGWGRGRYIGI